MREKHRAVRFSFQINECPVAGLACPGKSGRPLFPPGRLLRAAAPGRKDRRAVLSARPFNLIALRSPMKRPRDFRKREIKNGLNGQ